MATLSVKPLIVILSLPMGLIPVQAWAQTATLPQPGDAAASPPAAVENPAFAAASEAQRENWRQTLARTPRPDRGCFRAEFPDTHWQSVPCDYSRRPLRLPLGGGGARLETVGGASKDMMAQVPGGITQAEGSFESVTTSGATDSLAGAGKYSLQINTEFFDTKVCNGQGTGSTCQGWQQFVYDYDGSTSIQYWLNDYGPPSYTCPSPHGASCDGTFVYTDGWCEFALYGRTYCAVNSATRHASAAAPTALGSVKVQGNAAVGTGGTDSFTATVGGAAQGVNGGNYFSDLATKWHEAEFNVFGYGNSSRVNFDANTTLGVRVGVDSGASAAPGCDFNSFTAETNNLSIVDTTTTPPHNGHPSLVFTESNLGTPDPSCAAGVSVGDTHLTTFDGVHYDFQASGDFLLAQVTGEFTVQVRQASGAPQWPNAAVNKVVAVRMGRTRVLFSVEPASVMVDGTAVANTFEQPLMLADGVQLRRQGNAYTASDRYGNRVRATLNSNWIDTGVMIGHTPSHVRGLLGNPGGDGASLLTSTGKRIAAPVPFKQLYGVISSGWRVPPGQSLLGNEPGVKYGVPARPFYAKDLPSELAERGRTLCERAGVKDKQALEDCVLDVAVINDEAAVKAFVGPLMRPGSVPKPVFGTAQ
jgi:hypothetical protein